MGDALMDHYRRAQEISDQMLLTIRHMQEHLASRIARNQDEYLTLIERRSIQRYRLRVRDERHAGLLHVKATAARVRRELGLPPE